ncbi:MFS general substrate transporter [Apiospora arundinis]
MSTTIPRATDSRSGSICSLGSGTDSDDELEEDGAGSDSDLDRSAASLPDSAYASGEGDADERNLLQQFIDQCRIEGPTVANHDPKTTRVVDTENKKWQLFCKEMKDEEKAARLGCELLLYEPKATLEACDAAVFKGGIKKESSIMTYWNNLCMFYARETKRYMDGGILYDINNWVHAKLTPMFDLDTSKKEKAGLYVSDLDLILHHHWVTDEEVYAHERLRVQLAAILIIAGATSTRPEALIGNLRYRDVLFQLFPPGDGESGLAWESDRLKLRWKEEWLDRPIFRDVELANGVKISLTKALKYKKVRDHLVRLGIALGYAKRLEFYDIRRGSGKKLHKALSPEERNKAMGHKLGDSSTYTRYYMTHFIDADTQAIVFGGDLQSDFVHLMGRLVRNSHAPTKLTDQQMYEVNKDHQLAKLRSERDGINNRIKASPDAEIPELHSRRKILQNEIDSLTKKLRHNRFQTAIREFHETFHSDEVARQLHGIRPSTLLAPPSIEYDLPERAEVARLFSLAAEVPALEATREPLPESEIQIWGQKGSTKAFRKSYDTYSTRGYGVQQDRHKPQPPSRALEAILPLLQMGRS